MGSAPSKRGGAQISTAAFEKVLKQKGQLPLATVLRCRVRYFNDAAVLGSDAFVKLHLAGYRKNLQRKDTPPRPLAPITDWGGLTSARGLRKKPFG